MLDFSEYDVTSEYWQSDMFLLVDNSQIVTDDQWQDAHDTEPPHHLYHDVDDECLCDPGEELWERRIPFAYRKIPRLIDQ